MKINIFRPWQIKYIKGHLNYPHLNFDYLREYYRWERKSIASDDKLIKIFKRLPPYLIKMAKDWGTSDTVFREDFCIFLRNEPILKSKNRLEKIKKLKKCLIQTDTR